MKPKSNNKSSNNKDKSKKSGKSEKSGKSGKSAKSGKSKKSGKSGKSKKSGKSVKKTSSKNNVTNLNLNIENTNIIDNLDDNNGTNIISNDIAMTDINNNIDNTDNFDINNISNLLNNTTTEHTYEKRNKNDVSIIRIIQEINADWYTVELHNGTVIQIENKFSKQKTLEKNPDIKRILDNKSEPTYYTFETIKTKIGRPDLNTLSYKYLSQYSIDNWNKRNAHNKKIIGNWLANEIAINGRVCIYSRTSTKNEPSIESQTRKLLDFCEKKNLVVDYLVEDDNVSGKYNVQYNCMNNIIEDSEFSNVLKLLTNKHCLILSRIDRLGRYQPDVQRLLDNLAGRNISVYFLNENVFYGKNIFDKSEMTSITKNYIDTEVRNAYISNLEKSKILKDKHAEYKSKGLRLGGSTKYGLRYQDGRKKVLKHEIEIVKVIMSGIKKKKNIKKLVKELNAKPSNIRKKKKLFTEKFIKNIYDYYKKESGYLDSDDYYDHSKNQKIFKF